MLKNLTTSVESLKNILHGSIILARSNKIK